MQEGPVHVYACPCCGGLCKSPSFLSGNTFGAKFWSDGYVDGPMMPTDCALGVCAHCDSEFWPNDLTPLYDLPPWDGLSELHRLPIPGHPTPDLKLTRLSIDAPTITHLLRAAKRESDPSTGREAYLRQRIWWQHNDPARRGEPPTCTRDEYLENLQALLPLTSGEHDSAVLLRAEILRALGRFQESIDVLGGPVCRFDDPGSNPFGREMYSRAKAQDSAVFALPCEAR